MTLIILTGPTASGKTKLSVDIAKKINGEIVGADSIQIYQDLVIGSAAPTVEEMDGIPHHLIGTAPLSSEINAGRYIAEAGSVIKDIISRGKTPVMTGGTNFYVDAFLNGLSPVPEIDADQRNEFEKSVQNVKTEALFQKLMRIDPEWSAQISSPNDRQRINRGLIVFETTGKKLSDWNKMPRVNKYKGKYLVLGIDIVREQLYRNINKRTEKMISSGLIDEVAAINKIGYNVNNCKPLASIGYRETALFLDGTIKSKEKLSETIALNTRHLAKRQITWLKNKNYIKWEERSSIIECVLTCLIQD
ncbi:MAG TPA: tRNA (adenosine(37)-N6)-dimethylallyltransferase MiaA [bacterium]|nr:tRNA (adenosine(37)-N6)-dimethylallyltransferase MiaA [bacterium]HPS29147.1 tRNA (adenosine(37)-N6)-dimethylallyltransferase MiaA [bacterium]